jgi:YihY family inner membrane protein
MRMNPVERGIRGIDGWQRRFKPAAFVFGVTKKFGDDNGGVLVTNLAFTSFLSLFPLLLVLTTILGLVASHSKKIRADVISAVYSQVPLIGHTLQSQGVEQLQRNSVIGLIFGLLVLIWGASGLAQAGLFTMEQVWNLPGPDRPGYFQRLGRALLFLGMLGGGVIATTLLATLGSFGPGGIWVSIVSAVGAAVVNSLLYIGAFRILTPKVVETRRLLPGAVAGGVCYTAIQFVGTFLVGHYVRSDSVYGMFGTVLGLIAWIYLAVRITVYAAEVNVVLARKLWPRSIVQPPLTVADRVSLALQATQNRRRPEQHVEVTFDDHSSPPKSPAANS